MTPLHKQVAARIRIARTRRKMSQAELGKRCGIDQARISDAELGKGKLLIGTLGRIAKGLGVKTVYFFRTNGV